MSCVLLRPVGKGIYFHGKRNKQIVFVCVVTTLFFKVFLDSFVHFEFPGYPLWAALVYFRTTVEPQRYHWSPFGAWWGTPLAPFGPTLGILGALWLPRGLRKEIKIELWDPGGLQGCPRGSRGWLVIDLCSILARFFVDRWSVFEIFDVLVSRLLLWFRS